jgi:hypothetical protein
MFVLENTLFNVHILMYAQLWEKQSILQRKKSFVDVSGLVVCLVGFHFIVYGQNAFASIIVRKGTFLFDRDN